ncbi:hypothetical protein CLV96_0310 [Leptospira meyeri]|uniref:Uncharacterized protein n=1 Tax=Leptospira meyeri TaxID=29508 RepID=A0A4R8MTF8_LEPME|nr:hypothetical protein LEP1GSC017_3661 [Leptospira meyeri serovar Hardjo str. Went 5]TDY71348.1 hypothetical protein CLV96_0310 [Leptospira meyeri]
MGISFKTNDYKRILKPLIFNYERVVSLLKCAYSGYAPSELKQIFYFSCETLKIKNL